MSDFLENLQSVTENLSDIVFSRYVTITNVNSDNTVDCREDSGTIHKNVINATGFNFTVNDTALLGFVDNNVYNPLIIGGNNVNARGEGIIKNITKTTDGSTDTITITYMNGNTNTITITHPKPKHDNGYLIFG